MTGSKHNQPDRLRTLNTMQRQQIRSEIESIKPLDLLETEDCTRVLAWLDSGADLVRLVKPATPPKHMVSYFAVVDGSKILLVDHKNAQLWLPTGGHVEAGEHPRETVTRELWEELGIVASHEVGPPLMLTCTTTVGLWSGHTDVSLWYVVYAKQSQVLKFPVASSSIGVSAYSKLWLLGQSFSPGQD